MKLVIGTLTAALVFSSTAAAEEWAGARVIFNSGASTGPAYCTDLNGNGPSGGGGVVFVPAGANCPSGFVLAGANNGSSGPVLAVPTGASEAYSSVAISVKGVVADPLEASGYRFLQMTVPISEFARSSTVGSLGTQISSVSASMTLLTQDLASLQSSTSAADTALAGQVSSIGTRVSAIEGGLSTFATTSSLNGVSTRVSAIEGSLGSFATAGGLNAVSTRVSSLETTVASLPTAANLNALSARVSGAETQLAAIQSAVAGLEAFIPEALEGARREADEGSAMAAAMTTVAPADGKANRIGFNTATYNGSTAVAVSYSRAAGDVDFNVGVAMAGENAMVKAGAGFSW